MIKINDFNLLANKFHKDNYYYYSNIKINCR